MLHLLIEAEPDEDPRRSGRRGMGLDRIQPLMDFAQSVRVMAVLGFVEQAPRVR